MESLLAKRNYRNDVDSLDGIFDQSVKELELNGGFSLLPLQQIISSVSAHSHSKTISHDMECAVARAFSSARSAFHLVRETLSEKSHTNYSKSTCGVPLIDPDTDSGSWTGYHNASEINGRYNQFREGFVFSNGQLFDVNLEGHNEVREGNELECITEKSHPGINFEEDMEELFHLMHNVVADGVLKAIERRLSLPPLYFHDQLGPTKSSSQWHTKRYIIDTGRGNVEQNAQCEPKNDNPESQSGNGVDIFLPVHTDPSLISVVILDRPGVNSNAMGLEVFSSNKSEKIQEKVFDNCTWQELPNHGHGVAIIFVGSVLSYLTKGQIFPAVKHRVVDWRIKTKDDDGCCICGSREERMAVTLFVRPHGNALMKTLPSPDLNTGKKMSNNPPTFSAWNSRVATNYMKKKQRQKDSM